MSNDSSCSARPADLKTGGQAVIEGVMMKSPVATAVAVRTRDGRILGKTLEMKQLRDRGPLWGKPVFRGAAILIDTLRLGMKALNWSAEVAEEAEAEAAGRSGKKRQGGGLGTTALAFLMAIVLFAWLPLQASRWMISDTTHPSAQFGLHLLAGFFRIAAFLIYLLAISLMKEVRRLFMYHGAEHQTIHAWEAGLEPLIDRAVEQSPLHQRCGTSFLLLVMLGTVIFYGVFDSLVVLFFGFSPSAVVRVLYHLPLIPLVMGLSYEILKLADSHLETSALARAVTYPGLMLQKLTTRKAGRDEVEVAVASLRISLGIDPGMPVEMVRDGEAGEGGVTE
jgi:uncharacterized protein YqhQ